MQPPPSPPLVPHRGGAYGNDVAVQVLTCELHAIEGRMQAAEAEVRKLRIEHRAYRRIVEGFCELHVKRS
jgi:hypothetical protein